MHRFLCLTVVISALFLTLAGCSQNTAAPVDAKTVRIGTTKADLFGLPAEYRGLHMRLEKCFGEPVRFVPQPDGKALGQQLALGNISFAILSAGEYAQIEDPSKLTLIASGVNKIDKPARKALIITRANSSFKAIPELKGKRFAYGFHEDLLTDLAVRKALTDGGLPPKELFPDLLILPPMAYEGRLYLGADAAKNLYIDLTLDAAAVDETAFQAMPEKGGNILTGLSRDQFRVIGETMPIPEMVVVAGPRASADFVAKLKDELLNKLKDDVTVCGQLGVKGFVEPDKTVYEAVRGLMPKAPEK